MSEQPTPSRLNSPSREGEAEEEAEVTKEEGAVQVTLTQVEDTDNRTRIKISKVTDNRIRMRVSKLNKAEGEDHMKNIAYNDITKKCIGTMNLNVGRSKQINSQAEHISHIMKEKPQMVCFSHATRLKNNIKIVGCLTVDATIT